MIKCLINNDLRKEVLIIETMEMKPNFSFLARKYEMDYRTIKKYYYGYDGKPINHTKSFTLDSLHEVIKEKMALKGSKISSLYFFLKDKKEYVGSYSALTYYIRKHPDIKRNHKSDECHVRFETKPGEQIQFDWVEDITLYNKYGKPFIFNIFSSELSYSRMHFFKYSKTKTKEDVYTCLIDSFKYFGGVTKSVLTDNMSSIVDTVKLEFYSEFKQFAKDFGINANKCKVRHAYTKGKVEVRNKFIKWLIPYNYEFETEEELIEIISKINIEVNNRINSTTQMKPILLYNKEKEYLNQLPSKEILEHYLNLETPVKVQNTSLFDYKGNKYSADPKFINKTLKVKEIDNKLYVYFNTNLIDIHDITNNKINYKQEHYIKGLKSSISSKSDEQIEVLAKKNLELFDALSQLKKEGIKNE